MLTRAGFSDNTGFAHAFGQQRLTQYLIGFMSAAVQQIFTFQIDFGFSALGQVTAQCQRRRTTSILFQQMLEFSLKLRVIFCFNERFFQLQQHWHQNLGGVHPAKFTKKWIK